MWLSKSEYDNIFRRLDYCDKRIENLENLLREFKRSLNSKEKIEGYKKMIGKNVSIGCGTYGKLVDLSIANNGMISACLKDKGCYDCNSVILDE
tara:strand:- start:744 stop:1025 length:282 start_codon:yes stop_codon:yes gene_type:complete